MTEQQIWKIAISAAEKAMAEIELTGADLAQSR
jgi:hypothetical protein